MGAAARAMTLDSGPVRISHLDAAERVLLSYMRPMTSPQIVAAITEQSITEIGGETPWKTIGARLSSDIRTNGERSRFKRTYHGRFALRSWDYEPEFDVQRRVLNPLDETIKAVPPQQFLALAKAMAAGTHEPTNFRSLIAAAIDIPRREAEESDAFVQLIPTFVVCQADRVLTYRRTKRLPEARLHNARCVNFGGHMQADDAPLLFWDDDDVLNHFLYRELFEELEFDSADATIDPLGLIYLQGNAFERQHAGLTFKVTLQKGAQVRSLEPGMHTDLQFATPDELDREMPDLDSWSRVLALAVKSVP